MKQAGTAVTWSRSCLYSIVAVVCCSTMRWSKCCGIPLTIPAFYSSKSHNIWELLKKKAKWPRYRPGVAQRAGRGIALLFHDRGTRRGDWLASRLGRTLPPGKTRYPFYRRLGGPQGRSGWGEYLVLTAIRSRTVQPVVSRYNLRTIITPN